MDGFGPRILNWESSALHPNSSDLLCRDKRKTNENISDSTNFLCAPVVVIPQPAKDHTNRRILGIAAQL